MKRPLCFALMSLILVVGCQSPTEQDNKAAPAEKSVHDFALESLDGQPMPLSQFKGQVLLMVNVASNCGFTPQYEGLQKLHEAYADKGLVVMGIPANEFGGQEPGTNTEIKSFCENTYQVTFPMFSKLVVKGEGQHPLYQHLTTQGGEVTWNFNKFLVDKNGALIKHFESPVRPQSDELIAAIEAALTQ